jgi:hypothetical protein
LVHGKLIQEGKVEKLTYRQLRSLEKMDLEKEREKLLLGAPAVAIYQVGELAKTALDGVFKVGAAAAGANPISQGIDAVAAGLIVLWINQQFPGLAKFFHLDTWPGFPGAMLQNAPAGTAAGTPATGQPAGPGAPPTNYVIVPTGANIYGLPTQTLKAATAKALAGDVSGCMAILTGAGGDNQTALQYCSNTAVGVVTA